MIAFYARLHSFVKTSIKKKNHCFLTALSNRQFEHNLVLLVTESKGQRFLIFAQLSTALCWSEVSTPNQSRLGESFRSKDAFLMNDTNISTHRIHSLPLNSSSARWGRPGTSQVRTEAHSAKVWQKASLGTGAGRSTRAQYTCSNKLRTRQLFTVESVVQGVK